MNARRWPLVVLRGGGDLATGVAHRLHRCGFPVVVLELAAPMTVRRTVSFSSAVTAGSIDVEGVIAVLVDTAAAARETLRVGRVPVLVAPTLDGPVADLRADVVVDARLAKRNVDTTIGDAPLVVALGPGFEAGIDCHAVVETQRGPRLGRVIASGSAAPDTGVPGEVGGKGSARVLRAPEAGLVSWHRSIGDVVEEGEPLAEVTDGQTAGIRIRAPFGGVLRGAIDERTWVRAGQKVGDVDPRTDVDCDEISDKALAVAGGVLEAVLSWMNRRDAPS